MTDSQPSTQRAGTATSKPAASRLVQQRAAREAGARRALFITSVAGLATTLGVVAVSTGPPQAAAELQPAPHAETAAAHRIVAEVAIPTGDGRGVETIVRFVAPDSDTAAPDLRTRAT